MEVSIVPVTKVLSCLRMIDINVFVSRSAYLVAKKLSLSSF